MGVGKYSPTVSNWYANDQKWWEKNGGGEFDFNYDKDGFDSYGYNADDVDRAGNSEIDYMQGEWVGDDYVYDLYDSVSYSWNEPVPTRKD